VHYFNDQDQGAQVVQEIRASGGAAELFSGDIRDSQAAKTLVDAVVERWTRLDVLVNNAGIARDNPILKMTDEEWRDVIDTNLSGTFWMMREAARVMARQESGVILNVSSLMAVRGGFGNANYSASKAAVIALTKSAARELGRFHIRVNAIMPGFHETQMSAHLSSERREKLMAEHPLGHSTRAADLAAFMVALAENHSISGQVFNVDSRIP
jgi:3-oxoacyl-[acyl-carrier protein] reductase